MNIFKCKMCGGTIEFEQGATVGICDSCGTKQTLPKLDDERKAQMYDRANHFRRNNEFDKAMGIYESILNEDNSDAEAYWSLVLCRYGIEYVEDPVSHKRVPTVNRAQYTSIFADEDYKSAIENADALQKGIYEEEAKAIDEIQKGILEISQKEEPFDVFICYKETDANGRRTVDSVRATELYHELTKEGFKVFFSRITLEDKLGSAYEPYIFAALNSAKVMVVLGTKPEHFNAVWVKNEWSRYLSLIKLGAKKALIPAYENMDPYDLPEEFSNLQAQDMTKLGFMQDLIRGIKKITAKDEPKATVKETVVVNSNQTSSNIVALKKRGFMALEDEEWDKADSFFEDALNQDAEDAECYLGKLMAEVRIKTKDSLKDSAQPFDNNSNCIKACRFDATLSEKFKADNAYIRKRNEETRLNTSYAQAVEEMSSNTIEGAKSAISKFEDIIEFQDSKEKIEECNNIIRSLTYEKATSYMATYHYVEAIEQFKSIVDYKDSSELINTCNKENELNKFYEKGLKLIHHFEAYSDRKSLVKAVECFESISGWRNSKSMAAECKKKLQQIDEPTKEYFKKERIGLIVDIILFAVPTIVFLIWIIVGILEHNFSIAFFPMIMMILFSIVTFGFLKKLIHVYLTDFNNLLLTYDWEKEINDAKKSVNIYYLYMMIAFVLLGISFVNTLFKKEGAVILLILYLLALIASVARAYYYGKKETKIPKLLKGDSKKNM